MLADEPNETKNEGITGSDDNVEKSNIQNRKPFI
jgi:hypothetical protein